MKRKVLMLLLIAVFMIAFSYAQSITVTNPHSGSTWHKGSTYTIGWTKSGSMDNNVKITLYKPDHTTLQMIIVRPTANDGSFSWTIPNSIPNGQYIVRVKTIDNQVYDDSDNFTISESVIQPKLTMIFPLSGEKLRKNRTYKIRWKREGDMSSQVKIKLYKQAGHGVSFVMDVVSSCENNLGENFYMWRIPSVLDNGKYLIKIKTIGGGISTESKLFYIDNLLDNIIIGNNPATEIISLPDLYIREASLAPVGGTVNKTEFKVKVGNMGLKGVNNVETKLVVNGPENYTKVIKHIFSNISRGGSVNWKADFYFKKKGRYIFTYTVNESRGVREKRYDNNKIIKTIFTKGLPDLIVCVDDKKEVAPGKKVILNVDVKNIGDQNSCSRCNLQILIKNIVHDPTLPPDPPKIFSLPKISPGGHRSYTVENRWFLSGVRKVAVYVVCPINSDCAERSIGNNLVKTYIKVVGVGAPVHNTGKKKCSN